MKITKGKVIRDGENIYTIKIEITANKIKNYVGNEDGN